jgi:hypothetical protein
VNHDQHASRPAHDHGEPAPRRKFLRQIGMTAVATAAIAGVADVAGAKPAFAGGKLAAATNKLPSGSKSVAQKKLREIRGQNPTETCSEIYVSCLVTPGVCNGGKPCTPDGVWCHTCCYLSGGCGTRRTLCYTSCIFGHRSYCSSITVCD